MRKSENKLWELILSFHCGIQELNSGSQDWLASTFTRWTILLASSFVLTDALLWPSVFLRVVFSLSDILEAIGLLKGLWDLYVALKIWNRLSGLQSTQSSQGILSRSFGALMVDGSASLQLKLGLRVFSWVRRNTMATFPPLLGLRMFPFSLFGF